MWISSGKAMILSCWMRSGNRVSHVACTLLQQPIFKNVKRHEGNVVRDAATKAARTLMLSLARKERST